MNASIQNRSVLKGHSSILSLTLLKLSLLLFICLAESCVTRTSQRVIPQSVDMQKTDKITEAVLTSGDVLTFSKEGGRFQYLENVVAGAKPDGTMEVIPLDKIDEVRTRLYSLSGGTWQKADPVLFVELIDINDFSFELKDGSASFNSDKTEISGTLTDGKRKSFALRNIKAIFTQRAERIGIQGLSRFDSTQSDSLRIAQVVLKSRRTVTFRNPGAKFISRRRPVLIGITNTDEFRLVETNEILYVNAERISAGLTVLKTAGLVAALGGIALIAALATKESCPFIYSFDGSIYVFDAEPLGGATCNILERTELSRLEHLRISGGKYKLLVSNEVQETQFVNSLSLIAADHSEDEDIYPDNDGKLFIVKNPVKPSSAKDENGRNIIKFVLKDDNVHWQSQMPVDSSAIQENVINQLELTFPKPRDANSVNLVINAGTTLWGSNMIREMLMLRGNSVDKWYEEIDRGGDTFREMMSYLQSEELYQMRLYVYTKNGWKKKALINGGGPFISETRVFGLDIKDVEGEILKIRVNPPMGFWTLDYMAACYEAPSELKEYFVLKPILAVNDKGRGLLSEISSDDDSYYPMPDNSFRFFAEFPVPQQRKGTSRRTVFASTSGYYKIHLPKDKPPDMNRLLEFRMQKGSIVRYSNMKYLQWKKQLFGRYEEVQK